MNYRPIVLRSCVAKLFEIMVLIRMRNKVDNGWAEGKTLNNDETPGVPLLSPEQVAYCPFHSCVDHLSTLLGVIARRETK